MRLQYKALCALTLATSLFCSTQINAAESLMDNNVVTTKSGQIVRSKESGTCVRTKWEHGSDVCAPATEMIEKQIPQKLSRITQEEGERTLYFEFNKFNLTPESMRKLDAFSKKLQNANNISSTEIVGFADRIGSANDNQRLSKKRAESVKNYLASRGYLKTRVAGVYGAGESQSTTNCSSGLSRKKAINCLSSDRRVEIKVQYTESMTMSHN